MALKDVVIASSYNSDDLNVVRSFFEPVLNESISYKRVAAYFSSNSFKVLSEGLSAFLWNEGKLFFIIAKLISEEDYNSVLRGKSNPKDVISTTFIRDKNDLKFLARDENFKALAYLLASKKMEIKFVITSNKNSIFHLKFGVFEDRLGDKISFSGSINETQLAYSTNIEEFKVFRSWVSEENKYLISDEKRFDLIFSGKIKKEGYMVVELPDAVRNIILEIGDVDASMIPLSTEKPINLRDYQELAFISWVDQTYRGIAQMATGTGKTLLSIYCIRKVIELTHDIPILILIGVPTLGLINQWKRVLSDYIESEKILTTEIGKQFLYSRLSIFGKNRNGHIVIIGTYSTLCKDWFTKEIIDHEKYDIFFIGDEAHWLGAPEFGKAMQEEYRYRLGLTATPIRHFDIEGTTKVIDYFSSIIFKFNIKEAIESGYLVPYDYYVYNSSLTPEEIKEYVKLTKSITKVAYYNGSDNDNKQKKLSMFLNKRARIIKKASDKFRVVEDILDSLIQNNELKNLIIYFEDTAQIERFMIHSFPLFQNKIFRVINSKTDKDTRETLIQKFAEGDIDCIVCMKVLDEGIDIPTAERAIFISSSTNPKQFIQRRGRILRRCDGKRLAKIYDIFVSIDPILLEDEKLEKIDRNIAKLELTRICSFGINSSNKSRFFEDIDKIGKKTKIDVWEILRSVEDEK